MLSAGHSRGPRGLSGLQSSRVLSAFGPGCCIGLTFKFWALIGLDLRCQLVPLGRNSWPVLGLQNKFQMGSNWAFGLGS